MSTNDRLTTEQRAEVDVIINDHTDRVDDIVNKNVLVGATVFGLVAFFAYFLVCLFTDKSMTWWGAIGWIVFGALIGVVVGAFKKPQVPTALTEGRFERKPEPATSEQQVARSMPSLLGTVLKYGLIAASMLVLVYLGRVLFSSWDWNWPMAAFIALLGLCAGFLMGGLEYLRVTQRDATLETKLIGAILGAILVLFALSGLTIALGLPQLWFIFVFAMLIGAVSGYRMVTSAS